MEGQIDDVACLDGDRSRCPPAPDFLAGVMVSVTSVDADAWVASAVSA